MAWRDGDEIGGADNIDPPVIAILEARDRVASHDPVADDPVEVAAHKLVRAPRAHPGRDTQLAKRLARPDPGFERFDVAAAESDLGQMKRHRFIVAAKPQR